MIETKPFFEDHIPSDDIVRVIDVTYKEDETITENDMTEEQMRDKAMEEKIFVRDIENNKVFCPQGEILRPKSKHQGGIKFCNKLACKNCKNPCCKAEFKEVTFKPTQKYSYPNNTKRNTKKKRRIKIKVKKVIITTKTNKDLVKKRMSISEHSHASMKFWDNSRYMLLKGKRKVTGELALYYCASNIRRAVNKLFSFFEIFNNLFNKLLFL